MRFEGSMIWPSEEWMATGATILEEGAKLNWSHSPGGARQDAIPAQTRSKNKRNIEKMTLPSCILVLKCV
jgi:hypothetical protein